MACTRRIAIIGGNSSLARRLISGPLPEAVPFIRKGDAPGSIKIARYQCIEPRDLDGVSTVINCAGAVGGTQDELEEANVHLPAALAAACRDAGVRRLVHVSSFSVYGHARAISVDTPARPASPYGFSKLRGDLALLELASADFVPVVVRFPAILDEARPNRKVFQLLSFWRRAGFFPVPRGDVHRSMISSSMVAQVLAALTAGSEEGVVLAADRTPFTYGLAADVIEKATGKRARLLRAPRWSLAPLRAAPGTFANLYGDSLLDSADNLAADLESDLARVLLATLQGEHR